MFKKNKWPFIPVRLTEIISKETLAVIEAGCCERLSRAMTIIDADQQKVAIDRIDSINPRQHYEDFCACFRDEARVLGGNKACEQCDILEAKTSLEKSGHAIFRTFNCHMGLRDATYIVRLCGRPVAVLFSGQYRPPEGLEQIHRNVQNLGSGRYAHIKLLDEATRLELLSLAEKLPPEPPDFRDRLKREAEHIQKIAEAEYQRVKNQWEREFLDQLRAFTGCNEKTGLEQLRQCAGELLKFIQTFCRCQYVVFFASVRENNTVLPPIAEVGIPANIKKKLPHFNWKKAGLPTENFSVKRWGFARGHKTALDGIRGDNSDYFANAGCALPTTLSDRYRGLLVLGPLAEAVDLQGEEHFLVEIANTAGSIVLTELEVRYLKQERSRWESTAMLLTHQLRTSLTPITTQVGSARLLILELTQNSTTSDVADTLKRVEKSCLRLSRSARETLGTHVLLLEPEDLEFERYPLSVLVANCVEGFIPIAERRRRQLVLDKSIESLFEAKIDVARLTIALGNLIDNALKYSYPDTTIYVRSFVQSAGDIELATAVIEIDDLGDGIRPKDHERIFEQGTRGLTRVKMGRIPGSGLGLWETRAVVEAHGGAIAVSSKPTSIYRHQGQAHRVVFSVKIPLRQTK